LLLLGNSFRNRLSRRGSRRHLLCHDCGRGKNAHTVHLAAHVAGRFAAYEVQLRAAHLRTFEDFNGINHRRIEGEDFFNANARGDFAHGERRARLSTMLNRKDKPFKRLAADVFRHHLLFIGALGLFQFLDFLPYTHGVPRAQSEGLTLFHIDRGYFYRAFLHACECTTEK